MLKISDYFDAMESTIKAWGIPTVLFNPVFKDDDELEKLVTPAVFIICDELGVGGYSLSGNGSKLENPAIDLVCVVSSAHSDNAAMAVLNLASFIKRNTHGSHWGLGAACFAPKNVTAMNTTGRRDGLKEWRVSFMQGVELDPLPAEPEYDFNQVYLGINPKTDADYKLIGEIDAT